MQGNDGLNPPEGESKKPQRRVARKPASAGATARASSKAKSVNSPRTEAREGAPETGIKRGRCGRSGPDGGYTQMEGIPVPVT